MPHTILGNLNKKTQPFAELKKAKKICHSELTTVHECVCHGTLETNFDLVRHKEVTFYE